ncbi:MAG: hypothetical protein ACKVVT_17650 [Dehalococcoidia bacterium]
MVWLLMLPVLAVGATGALLSGCTDRWAGPTVEDATGNRYDVREEKAPKGCGWERVQLLTVPALVVAAVTKQGDATGVITFASDPLDEAGDALAGPYELKARVDPGVVKTRYHKGDRELWIRPDDRGEAVLILDSRDNTVERWPRIAHACLDAK